MGDIVPLISWIPGVFKTEREVLRGINKKVSTDSSAGCNHTLE